MTAAGGVPADAQHDDVLVSCALCGNQITWLNGGWWHCAPALSPAPMALSPFAAQLDADHEPEPRASGG